MNLSKPSQEGCPANQQAGSNLEVLCNKWADWSTENWWKWISVRKCIASGLSGELAHSMRKDCCVCWQGFQSDLSSLHSTHINYMFQWHGMGRSESERSPLQAPCHLWVNDTGQKLAMKRRQRNLHIFRRTSQLSMLVRQIKQVIERNVNPRNMLIRWKILSKNKIVVLWALEGIQHVGWYSLWLIVPQHLSFFCAIGTEAAPMNSVKFCHFK